MANRVPLRLGEWLGEETFTIIPLDDFDVVLGHNFIWKAKETPMSLLECLAFLSRQKPIYVQLVRKLEGSGKVTSMAMTNFAGATKPNDGKGKGKAIKDSVIQ